VRRLMFFVPLALAAVAVAALAPLASSTPIASDSDPHVVIGFHESFTGPSTLAGTWIMAGAVSDSGTRTEQLSIGPSQNGTDAPFTVVVDYQGSLGTFRLVGRGVLGPLGDRREAAEGTWTIVTGTGDYAGATGEGQFAVTGDFVTNDVIGTGEGLLRLAQ
jgi:hypothetical protein